jgi:membrane-associated protease RseP (regulator of RpoE activity)
MDANELNPQPPPFREERPPLLVELVPEFAAPEFPVEEPSPSWPGGIWLPATLLAATCVSTFVAGVFLMDHVRAGWTAAILDGTMYAAAVMMILLCHELGHFVQAQRYGVHASLPYFIPMPLTPIGTFGAVILMGPRKGNVKAVFDIGITGPLAGLVPTLIFLCLGLAWSHCRFPQRDDLIYGVPLLVKLLFTLQHGTIPAGQMIAYHPIAFAGWVGLLITSINLIPIGQLDGGHILYGMFRRRAHVASLLLLIAAIWASIQLRLWAWWPMLGLITFLGTRHPPTADDSVPLGTWRYVLGAATLGFILLGFTPVPIHVLGQ